MQYKTYFKRLFSLTLAGTLLMGSVVAFGANKEFPSITLNLPSSDGKTIKAQAFTGIKISSTLVEAGKIGFSPEALASYKSGKGLKESDKPDFATYLKFVQNKATTDMIIEKQVVAAKMVAGQELTPEKIDAKLKLASGKVDQLKALIPKILMGGQAEMDKAEAILGEAMNNPKEIVKQFEAAKKQIEVLKKQKAAFDLKLKVELSKNTKYTALEALVANIKASQKSKVIGKDLYAILISGGSEGFDFNQFTYQGIIFK